MAKWLARSRLLCFVRRFAGSPMVKCDYLVRKYYRPEVTFEVLREYTIFLLFRKYGKVLNCDKITCSSFPDTVLCSTRYILVMPLLVRDSPGERPKN